MAGPIGHHRFISLFIPILAGNCMSSCCTRINKLFIPILTDTFKTMDSFMVATTKHSVFSYPIIALHKDAISSVFRGVALVLAFGRDDKSVLSLWAWGNVHMLL